MTQAVIASSPTATGKRRSKALGTHGSRSRFSLHDAMGELLGVEVRSDADVLKLQRRGVPYKSYARLAEHLPNEAITLVVSSRASLQRRKAKDEALSREESERAVRIARVLARAIEVFGDEDEAKSWFNEPAPYIEGEDAISPLEMCAYEAGAKIIEDKLARVAYGMF